MDEVSAEAKLASEGVAQSLAVAVPRLEVQRAIDEKQEADLMLDVVRTNGQREERRVFVAFDGETLRSLITDQAGDQILFMVDPESLATSFDDVEAHGLREIGATFAIAVAAVGAGAGTAGAEGLQPALSTDHAVQATVQSDMRACHVQCLPTTLRHAQGSSRCRGRCLPTTLPPTTRRPRCVVTRGRCPRLGRNDRPCSVGSRTSVRLNLLRRGARCDGRDRGCSRRWHGGPRSLDRDRERPRRAWSGGSRRRWHNHLCPKHGCGGGDRGWSDAHDRSGRLRASAQARARTRLGILQMGRRHGPSGGFSPLR